MAVETEYFQCTPGCGKCCPEGTLNALLVPLNLEDIKSLYSIDSLAPEQFVQSQLRWKLDGDGLGYYVWWPVLPTPCPYLNEEMGCDIHDADERPIACKTFPENYLLNPQFTGLPQFIYPCVDGKVLSSERRNEVSVLEDRKIQLTAETDHYLRDIEVDQRIKAAVIPYIGKIPLITMLNVMLENIDDPGFQEAAQQAKRDLDQRIIDFLQEQEATVPSAAQQSAH